MPMNRQEITHVIAEYFKTQPVLKAWIFGSFSRGEETPDSDIDILVDYDDNANVSLFTIGATSYRKACRFDRKWHIGTLCRRVSKQR